MQDTSSSLSCNSCHSQIEGIAYRTSCLHLLCPACAKHSFADGRTCVVCSSVLSKGKVKEVVIGVAAQVEISSSLFQMAFATANLGSIVDNLDSMRHAFAELENLVSTQLLLEASQLQGSARKALQDNEILHDQLSSAGAIIRSHEESTIREQQDAESLLHSKDTEISELKDAYKEKHRKCQAWEKAYNNIRDQVIVPNEAPSTDQHKYTVPQHLSSYSGSVHKNSLSALRRGNHHDRSEVSAADYQAHDSNTSSLSSSSGARTGTLEQSFPHSAQLSPPPYTVPARALRRTEVTTYSKSFVPVGKYNSHCLPPSQAAQQHPRTQDLSVNMKNGSALVSGSTNLYDMISPSIQPQYFQSYSSPPIQQQMSTSNHKNLMLSDPAPVAGYQRAGYKRRQRSPTQDKVKSSFFD